MRSTIAYDITHLAHRCSYPAPAGIEKVDLAFAEYFERESAKNSAVHYGFGRPIVFSSNEFRSILDDVRGCWQEHTSLENDIHYKELKCWLLNRRGRALRGSYSETSRQKLAANSLSIARTMKYSLLRPRSQAIPSGAIYLNVAQYALEVPIYFRWLSKRPDLRKVFFIHDLLPLDYPEFWPPAHRQRFARRVACATTHGTAFITSSYDVRDRLRSELERRGRRDVPIFTDHLPPPNAVTGDIVPFDSALAKANFFVAIGTLEPRKNHLLLLEIWRELARAGGKVPKLVLIGKRGWSNEQLTRMIDLAPHCNSDVAEISALSSAAIRELLLHANAVLIPSFAEGFGLPVVEALTAGTPLVASDIPVFREVASGCALFHHPLDGAGWLNTIRELTNKQSSLAQEARAAAARFRPTTVEAYFGRLEDFLGSLS